MKRQWQTSLVVGAVLAVGSVAFAVRNQASDSQGVSYEVKLTSHWMAQNFPLEYPKAGLLTGPHFSGLIGASHKQGYTLFEEGKLPSPGLERLSEEGKHSPFDKEIQAAKKAGEVLQVIESAPLKDFSKSVSTQLTVNDTYHLVSLAAMIAPSPDWFLGETNIDLKANGEWVPSKSIEVYAWDSGGDNGDTYLAPDMDNNPKVPTTMNKDRHFMPNGIRVPVATLTFTRK